MSTRLGEGALVVLDVLVVEDDPDIAHAVAEVLRARGHAVTITGNGDRALAYMEERVFDLVVADVRLPGADGLALLRRIRDTHLDTGVILMSAFGTIAEAVDAVKNDAAHYLSKPFAVDEMIAAVGEVEARFVARRSRSEDVGAYDEDGGVSILGESPAMVALRGFLRDVARAEGPVLITGETGTGKELVASTIHALSDRRDEPFVAVNCAAFPDTLLEAELFGHERGAFTGAVQRREGRFRTAHKGTLFLDEVAEMSPGAQVKLLRTLETGTLQPLGSDASHEVDVRIVSATNAELCGDKLGQLREDLFYRIKMFHVQLSPLRSRLGDLPLLVAHFLATLGAPEDPPALTARAWAALQSYDYPGNVRELRSIVGHALALCGEGDIDVKHLPSELRGESDDTVAAPDGLQPLAVAERAFRRDYLRRTLDATGGNKTRAAELLGISRKTLWKKLRDLEVD